MDLIVVAIYFFSQLMKAENYDESDALTALYFAYGAYCSSDALESWNCKYCENSPHFTIDKVFESKKYDLQGFTGYDSQTKQVVVSFRGSKGDDIKNIFLDFDWSQVYFKDGEKYKTGGGDWAIHEGFYKGLKQMIETEDGLYQSLQTLFKEHPRSDVLLTGHSMGGALAQMLALMFNTVPLFESFSFGHVDIISFGAPRWGSEDISEYFNSLAHSNWRVVNKFDIIPTLPTKSTADYGYYHTLKEVEYTEFGTLDHQLCDGDGESSTNCQYHASWNIKYHVNYLNVYEDRCGERKPRCRSERRRSLQNSSCVEEDEWFSAPSDEETPYVSHTEWIVIGFVCAGCLLTIAFCCFLSVKWYRKAKKGQDQEEEDVAYLKIDDNL